MQKKEKFIVGNVDEIIEKYAKGSGKWLLDKINESKENREFILKELQRLISCLNKKKDDRDE